MPGRWFSICTLSDPKPGAEARIESKLKALANDSFIPVINTTLASSPARSVMPGPRRTLGRARKMSIFGSPNDYLMRVGTAGIQGKNMSMCRRSYSIYQKLEGGNQQ